jgi:hypothetical protein
MKKNIIILAMILPDFEENRDIVDELLVKGDVLIISFKLILVSATANVFVDISTKNTNIPDFWRLFTPDSHGRLKHIKNNAYIDIRYPRIIITGKKESDVIDSYWDFIDETNSDARVFVLEVPMRKLCKIKECYDKFEREKYHLWGFNKKYNRIAKKYKVLCEKPSSILGRQIENFVAWVALDITPDKVEVFAKDMGDLWNAKKFESIKFK